jgi:hydroxymethylglutaryl-CoA reductase
VNTVCERLAPEIQALGSGARIGLRILSNYADRRLFKVCCRVDPAQIALKDSETPLSGAEVARRIVEAYVFAKHDPYRAATHNKGIMNGVDPVVIATGNDWRAVEAGVHAYAARNGRYESLSRWSIDADGWLVGELTLPLQLGTVGGVTRLHPLAQLALQILGNPSSDELSLIAASTGLASNLAALRALTTTGIQAGHMKLHAKNLALAAGAEGTEIEIVAASMVRAKNVSASEAERVLAQLRAKTDSSLVSKPAVPAPL